MGILILINLNVMVDFQPRGRKDFFYTRWLEIEKKNPRVINLKCFDKGLFTSIPLNFGEWHLVMQIWLHFVLNVHYMPAYVAHENITI